MYGEKKSTDAEEILSEFTSKIQSGIPVNPHTPDTSSGIDSAKNMPHTGYGSECACGPDDVPSVSASSNVHTHGADHTCADDSCGCCDDDSSGGKVHTHGADHTCADDSCGCCDDTSSATAPDTSLSLIHI